MPYSISFEEYLKIVNDSLMSPQIDRRTEDILLLFMDAYIELRNIKNNSNLNPEAEERLNLLQNVINKATILPQDNLHPAAKYITNRYNELQSSMGLDKGMVRSLKNPNFPSVINEEEKTPMNGFSLAIILVCFTIVIGMVLGALLFVIK